MIELRVKPLLLIILIIILASQTYASSLPGDWWGKVTINGNPGNDGAVVDAYIDGIHIASATVGEFVSGYYLIHVEGKVGDFVYFKVNDIYVNEPPQQWSRGNHPQFDLTVNYCILGETETVSCYTGPGGTEGVGICSAGNKTRVCQEDFTWGEYGSCIGEILPLYEICDNFLDEDCDGQLNNGCECIASETERECIDDGYADVTYGWNYDYCGDSFIDTVEDETCGCEYTCWEDDECVSDGIMLQIRTELSGYDYCTDSLEQEVPNDACNCEAEESGRICIEDGYAEITYGWNYDYCGQEYTETVQDSSCSCDYTEWTDDECVSDGYMKQIRTETSGYPYCTDPLEQEVPNEICNCEAEETGRECVSDGYSEITYTWNYDYCGCSYTETVEDESCSCEYTCWEDGICVDEGYMKQIRTETTGYAYCTEPLEQEIPDEICDCESHETGKECVSDGYADVIYEWNYDYCGCSYTETIEDETCVCDYTEWEDDECVSDGYLKQTRTELSGYEYCTEDLERTVEYTCCTCKYTEWQDIECISEEYMQQVRYETTEFDYCDDEQYQEIEDAVCNCDYSEWQDDECVEDGIIKQLRTETSGHDYCNESLTREIQNEICSCISTEISRECVENATALVNYSWNYPYCEPDSEYVYDESCLICIPSWICTKYSNCTSENYQYCAQVQDTNNCGECYTRDYSEFIKECNYCSIHGPKITTADEISVYEGDLVTLNIEMTDPDQDPLTYSISAPVGNDKEWQTQEGDKGEYNVLITVSDGICTTTETIKIIVKGESQQSLIIKRTNYNEFIKPGETQELYITLENTGNENIEDLKITAFIDSLGIWKTTRKFDLKKGDETTKLIELDIPYYAPKGLYYIRIVVSNDKIRKVIYRDFDVI